MSPVCDEQNRLQRSDVRNHRHSFHRNTPAYGYLNFSTTFMHPAFKPALTDRFYGLIKQCSDLASGRQAFDLIIKHGLDENCFLASHLIRMFVFFGSLQDAEQVFDKLVTPTAFAWSAIISAHEQLGDSYHALSLYKRMWQQLDFTPNEYIFVHTLKACANETDLAHARLIYSHVVEVFSEPKLIVANSLLDACTKCGDLEDAIEVFDWINRKDIVTWNIMIVGYAKNGCIMEAVSLFEQMQKQGVRPSHVTWNGLIGGCSLHGRNEIAQMLFERMQNEGLHPNHGTFVSMLRTCSGRDSFVQGISLHIQVLESNMRSDLVIGSTLIDMYVKCGRLEHARCVFDSLPNQDNVTWNTMLSGYAEHGFGHLALQLFCQMQENGVNPDNYSFVSAVKACTKIGSLDQGREMHSLIIEDGFNFDTYIGSALTNMYCKWLMVDDGHKVLESMPEHNSVICNAMIAGFANQSDYKKAMDVFESIKSKGLTPDEVTFISLLSACSHSGLVDEAFDHIKGMEDSHGVSPSVDHYECLLDVIGRAGYIIEAGKLQKALTCTPSVAALRSLLSHCKTHGNVELGKQCFVQVSALDKEDSAGYLLMSNLFAYTERWVDAIKLEESRRYAGALKKPGMAFIEVDNHVHHFLVGDSTSLETDAKLKRLRVVMMQKGYMPTCDSVLPITPI